MLCNRFLPFIALLCGMLILDKRFAYLGVPGTRIYITEIVLAVSLVLQFFYICVKRKVSWSRLSFKYIILLYIACGTFSLIRGSMYGLDALRDYVLVYYFSFTVAVLLYITSIERLRTFVNVLIFGWAVSSLYFLLEKLLSSVYSLPPQHGPPHSMYMGMAIVFVGVTLSLWRHPRLAGVWLLLLVWNLSMVHLRSGWVGFAVGVLGVILVGIQDSVPRFVSRRPLYFVAFCATFTILTFMILQVPVLTRIFGEVKSIFYIFLESVPEVSPHRIRTAELRVAMWVDVLREVFANPVTAMFGVPMGKPFMPPSAYFMKDVISGFGMDPHNSHLAILYRMGVVGFTLYGLLIWITIQRSIRILSQKCVARELRIYLLAFLGAFLVILGNACFTVILESPQGAIFFWVILGCIFAVQALATNGMTQEQRVKIR